MELIPIIMKPVYAYEIHVRYRRIGDWLSLSYGAGLLSKLSNM